jgi:hypothetical protein
MNVSFFLSFYSTFMGSFFPHGSGSTDLIESGFESLLNLYCYNTLKKHIYLSFDEIMKKPL